MEEELFFVECQGTEAPRRPSMRERRALEQLRRRGFGLVKLGELRSLLRELFVLTSAVVIKADDVDDTAERLRRIDLLQGKTVFELDKLVSWNPHPYFWTRLGGSSEVPEHDYVTYLDPSSESTPTNSRWTGGLLTLDCLLFFVQHPLPALRARALALVGVRSRRNEETSQHYRLLLAAQELVRGLGLVFGLLTTTTVETTGVPVQPNLRPWPAYVADHRESPFSTLPMRSYWSFLSERNAFERLFSCSLLLFDTLYEGDLARRGGKGQVDVDSVMKQTGLQIEALLVRSANLGAMEEELVTAFCDLSKGTR